MSVDAKDWEESYDAFMRATAGGIVIPDEEEAEGAPARRVIAEARRGDEPTWFDSPPGQPVAELFETIVAADGLPAHDLPEPRDALTPELLVAAETTRVNLAAQEARDTRPLTADEQEMVDAIADAERERLGRATPADPPGVDGRQAQVDPTERPWPRPRSEADPGAAMADVWHTDGIARPGRLVVIAAAEGVGKSYARLEWSIRLATGHGALFNHYRIAKPCRVLTFDVENGEEEETRREEEVLARLGLARSDLGDYWSVSLEGLQLTDPTDQAYIRVAIERSSPGVAFFEPARRWSATSGARSSRRRSASCAAWRASSGARSWCWSTSSSLPARHPTARGAASRPREASTGRRFPTSWASGPARPTPSR